jgi:glucosyl-3-phosphoglycerate phosphatase
MKRITLIRHAETEANAAGIWQGQGDAGLSEEGTAQARALGARLHDAGFTRVVASDLRRTVHSARVAGLDPMPDSAWREMDIGAWEGLTRDEVYDRFPDEMASLAAGEEVPMGGGGETWLTFGARARAALDGLVADMGEGEHAVVVTHGGVIHAIVSSVLGIRRGRGPWPIDRVGNTSLTDLVAVDGRVEVHRYNDAAHLDTPAIVQSTLVALIRHGESAANVRGEWHGRSDGPLSDEGREQAGALAARMPAPDAVFTSPLARAWETAVPLAAAHGLRPTPHDGLREMDLGEWEGMTWETIMAEHAHDWAAVDERGHDLARGSTGETFAAATARGTAALDDIVGRHRGGRVAVVTHGVLIRAVVSNVLGVAWPASRLLGMSRNTAVSHLRFEDDGPVLMEYNV